MYIEVLSSSMSQHAMYHVESFSDFSVSLEHRQAFFDVCFGSKVCTSCVLRVLCVLYVLIGSSAVDWPQHLLKSLGVSGAVPAAG